MSDYIPIKDCKNRFFYELDSRNLAYGVYNEQVKGFIGIREKFDNEYICTEFHWDTGPSFGTVKPLREICELPAEIELRERFDTIDSNSGRKVAFDKPIKDGGKGWYFLDTGEPSQNINATSYENDALFDWIKAK